MSQEKKPVMRIAAELSDGDSEAMDVCVQILLDADGIDPDSKMAVACLQELQNIGISGGRIRQLYKEVCGGRLDLMIAVIRAYQLDCAGVTKEAINFAIVNRGQGLDLEAIVAVVQAKLPAFDFDI